MITERNTKAEILAALRAKEAQLQSGPSWPQIGAKMAATAAMVWQELQLAIRDTYNAGRQARQLCDTVVAELRQPVLRSKI